MKRFLWIAVLMALALLPNASNSVQAQTNAPQNCKPGDQAWIGSFGYGANCLDGAGWHTYDKQTGAVTSDQTAAIALCNGKVWIANTLGITMTDGSQTTRVDTDFSGNAIACKGNDVYVAHQNGLSHWNGSGWDTIDAKNFGTGDTANDVVDVVIAPDGKLWVATLTSIATGDGKTWTVFEKGKGFSEDEAFVKLAIDSKGNVWTNSPTGLYKYDGKTWNKIDTDTYSVLDTLIVGPSDKIYVGSFAEGLAVYDGSAWTTYDRSNSTISSNEVHSLAVDGQGRVWVGTEYGLDIFDGKTFTSYLMANSRLVDNAIVALAVTGNGPALPAPITRKPGSLSGTVVTGTTPLAGAAVEVCTEFIGSSFTGNTPCSDNPFFKDGKTGADGKFTVPDLPPGLYGMVIQAANGKWVRLTDSIAESRFEVKEGGAFDLGTIDLSTTKSS
ncbi:MAG TPA: two-component regulator propeller domain-containing protein [Aggregatilineales bacterium]|nr:two-component regulator propeller domain-containing protein [Aggregatilineales bacterium]